MWPTEADSKLGEFDLMELPGQQLNAAHAFTPLDHVLNLDIRAPPACLRLTGIMANMGKSTYDVEVLERMIAAGMNIALLNMSFGTKDTHIDCIKMLRTAAKNYSMKMNKNYPLAIAIKLSGKKIRTGKIGESFGETIELRTGDTVRLTTDETYSERCSIYTIYIDFLGFAEQMKKHDLILLDNEAILLKVEVISASTITCQIERGGTLGSFKDVFVPNKIINMPHYSEKDKSDIDMAVRNQVDIVVADFVNTSDCLKELRVILGEKGKKIFIMADIQTAGGLHNFDDILAVADGVIITRQELGTDVSPKKLVIAQKNLVARANKANVPVCISASLLTSMRYNKLPSRAEILDIANCVLDGVDILTLCAETSVGLHPVDAVSVMSGACKEAEACMWTKQIFYDLIDKTTLPCDQVTGTALGAVLAAQRAIAAAIVVVTTTGKSAKIVAKYRPRCPIIAVTRYPIIARHLHMWRAVLPLIYEENPDADWQVDIEKRVMFAVKWAMDLGFIRIGDPVIILSGWRQGSGFTNTMRIAYANPDGL